MIQDLFLYLRFYNSKISAKYSSVSSVSNIGSLIKWGRRLPHNSGDGEVCPVSNLGKFEISVGL